MDNRNFTTIFGEPITLNCTIENVEEDSFVNYAFWIKTISGKNQTLYSGHPGTKGIDRLDPSMTILRPTFKDS